MRATPTTPMIASSGWNGAVCTSEGSAVGTETTNNTLRANPRIAIWCPSGRAKLPLAARICAREFPADLVVWSCDTPNPTPPEVAIDGWLVLCPDEPPPPPVWRSQVGGTWAVFPGSAANWTERAKAATEAWSPDVVLSDLLREETEHPILSSWLKERDLVWLPAWGGLIKPIGRQLPFAVVIDANEDEGVGRVLGESCAQANHGKVVLLQPSEDNGALPAATTLVPFLCDPVLQGVTIRHAALAGSNCVVFGRSPAPARRRVCGAETKTIEFPRSDGRIREPMQELQAALLQPPGKVREAPLAAWGDWARSWMGLRECGPDAMVGAEREGAIFRWLGAPLKLEGADAERWSTVRWMLAEPRRSVPYSLRTLVGDEGPVQLVEFLRRPLNPAWLECFARCTAAIPTWTERCEHAVFGATVGAGTRADLLVRIAEGCFHGVAWGFSFDWRRGPVETALRLVRDARAIGAREPRLVEFESTLLAALGRFREAADAAPDGRGTAEAGWTGLLQLMPAFEGHAPLPEQVEEVRTWVRSCFATALANGAVNGIALHGSVLLAAYEGDVARAILAAETARARRGAVLADLTLAAIHAWFVGDETTAQRCLAAETEWPDWPTLQRVYFAAAHALFGDAQRAVCIFRGMEAEAATLFSRVEGPSFRWQVLAASLRALGDERQAVMFAQAGKELHPYGALRNARVEAVRLRAERGALPSFISPTNLNRGYREPLRPPPATTEEYR